MLVVSIYLDQEYPEGEGYFLLQGGEHAASEILGRPQHVYQPRCCPLCASLLVHSKPGKDDFRAIARSCSQGHCKHACLFSSCVPHPMFFLRKIKKYPPTPSIISAILITCCYFERELMENLGCNLAW